MSCMIFLSAMLSVQAWNVEVETVTDFNRWGSQAHVRQSRQFPKSATAISSGALPSIPETYMRALLFHQGRHQDLENRSPFEAMRKLPAPGSWQAPPGIQASYLGKLLA